MTTQAQALRPAETDAWWRAPSLDVWIGGALLALVFATASVGPAVWSGEPLAQDLAAVFQPPSTHATADGTVHPLGTDQLGRDLLARILLGARLSLGIVLVAAAVAALLGITLGIVAGYCGGWLDSLIMRLVDVQSAIPFVLLVVLIVSVLGAGLWNLTIVMGVTGWAVYARVARAQALGVRELEYVEAARAMGGSSVSIMARHILPNIGTSLVVLLTLDLPRLVILESAVGFLGLGAQPPTPTLGSLIGEGRDYMLMSWWLVVWPGTVIAMLVVGFSLVGDYLVWRLNTRLE